jgi:hypothetical protein
LTLSRVDAARVQGPPTFGNVSRTAPPTCPRTVNKVLVFQSMITSANGLSDAVTGLYVLSEVILTAAGNGLSPAGYDDLAFVREVGPEYPARFADERLPPEENGRLVFRGRMEIPVSVSLVTTTDILGS